VVPCGGGRWSATQLGGGGASQLSRVTVRPREANVVRSLIVGAIIGVAFSIPPIGVPLHTRGLVFYTPFWLPLAGSIAAIVSAHRGLARHLLFLVSSAVPTSAAILWWVGRDLPVPRLGFTLIGAWVVGWIAILSSPVLVPLAQRLGSTKERAA
jgi:hypothetical protein